MAEDAPKLPETQQIRGSVHKGGTRTGPRGGAAEVRLAHPGDAGALARIYAPIVRDTAISFEEQPPTPDDMARRIETTLERFPWLVLEAEETILGYAYAGPYKSRPAYRWSVDVSVYVAPSARRRGVARRLYEALFDQLRRLGYFSAFAGITLPNPASVGLHERLGFEPAGVAREVGFKLGQWHDVGLWRLALRTPEPGQEPDEPSTPLCGPRASPPHEGDSGQIRPR